MKTVIPLYLNRLDTEEGVWLSTSVQRGVDATLVTRENFDALLSDLEEVDLPEFYVFNTMLEAEAACRIVEWCRFGPIAPAVGQSLSHYLGTRMRRPRTGSTSIASRDAAKAASAP